MELRVLGPIELVDDTGPIALPAAKPRALLAALAIHRGRPRDADFLVDAVWGEHPPASAQKLLQVYVSQLRRVLPSGVTIATRATGYALEIDDEHVDAARFEAGVADGRAALRAGNPWLASAALRRALALWRGPAYADVRFDPFARDEIERLESIRDAARENRIEADLRLGRHAEVLGELRGLLSADPTHEHVAEMTMLAAYRAEDAGEALEVFERVRAALRDELDADPRPSLQSLRDRVVRRDPSLAVDQVESSSPALPHPPNPLAGRDRELRELESLLARPGVRLISLTGAGGSGKSRLGLELAHAVGPQFANGAALVELAALRDPDLVLPTIARAVDIDPGGDAFAALTEWLAPRELLLVVDNAEHLREAAPELVRLLAVAPRLVVVVTTRVVLHVSGEHVYPVSPLADPDAVALFGDRARASDPSFALDGATQPLVAEIVRRLDGLPLPIELAAARVRALGIRGVRDRLASRLSVATGGPRDLPARQQTLRETLDWSVRLLDPHAADVLARLAVFPSGCTSEGAGAVAGADDGAIGDLVDHHLLQALELNGERRFRLLETVREYAYERLGDRRGEVEAQLVAWMESTIDGSQLNAAGPQPEALARLDQEVDTLRDALRHAARDPDSTSELRIAAGVWRFWWIRGYLAEGRAALESILARRGLVATPEGARVARACASMAWSMGEPERAEALANDALALAMRACDVPEQVAAHNLLGVIANSRDDGGTAAQHLRESIELAESAGLPHLAVTSKLNLGITHLEADQLDEARVLFREVLAYREAERFTEGIGFGHLNLGETEFLAGDLDRAEAHFGAAAEAFGSIGFQSRHGNALQGLAAVEAATGRHEDAARHLGVAAALIAETGWNADGTGLAPEAETAAREALGDLLFEQRYREGQVSRSA